MKIFSKGCWISQYCGIGLTPEGYFPCAVAGGIERIMKLGKGVQSLPDNDKSLKDMYSSYCQFCGHFLPRLLFDTGKKEKQKAISPLKCQKVGKKPIKIGVQGFRKKRGL